VCNLDNFISEIKSFALLDDGWDGYNANVPDKTVINNMITLLRHIPKRYVSFIADVQLSTYGTIYIEWYNDNDYLYVEVGNSLVDYLLCISNNNTYNNGIEFEQILSSITPMLNMLYPIEYRKHKIDTVL
jgi:hypothetical protein